MNDKKYIYIVQELYRNKNRGFSFFENHDEMRKYICDNMPTYKEDYELENETHTEYIVTRIIEDEKNKVTYNNIKYINDNGKIEFIEEEDDDDYYLSQPDFLYEIQDEEYRQKYSEFYYTIKDGKYIDYIEGYDTLEEMSSEYFDIQTL